jgi:hypothetical protein
MLPRPFDTFVNATPGPYVPGDKLEALAFTVSVIVMPVVSAVPAVELTVSQDGVLIEYLTVPVDALTRYSISDGENGPPGGPEKAALVDGLTINDGADCPAGFWAALICADNTIAGIPSKAIEASQHLDTSTRRPSPPKSDTQLV